MDCYCSRFDKGVGLRKWIATVVNLINVEKKMFYIKK